MKTIVHIHDTPYEVDLSNPLDISIPLQAAPENPNAWYVDAPVIKPVEMEGWVGKVSEGASVNFNDIYFNPHAHGTHTECVGHITEEFYSVNRALTHFFFLAEVISVTPEERGADEVITLENVQKLLDGKTPEALVIRTLPNPTSKKEKQYSHSNWPYLEEALARYLCEIGMQHLLIDLPSVDKEKDEGQLLAHKAFWNYPTAIRHEATITEFIYVPEAIEDGSYLLNLQIASFENDATPSKPVLYQIK
ncbi:cyclase family protein [Aureisphaera galaxeae]|uniref:cyclase family protein n=1 Tax=Aureisphaera galaxeae TaxID=1538023 RepID=UPI002350B7C1|nr:cyclase family protein [Aureisphaera galaxeae]MDC8002876.1 cyclase family protein [Aureisphaera galaxeae]